MKPLSYVKEYLFIPDSVKPGGVLHDWYVKAMANRGPDNFGIFRFPLPRFGSELHVIADISEDWDHVSVSMDRRTPNWEEMDFIYRKFFWTDEVAVQYHIQTKDKVNIHEHCLHIWRPVNIKLPRPPKASV